MTVEYHVERNKWGGFYVVDHLGNLAPRPHGFNQDKDAEGRAAELNRAEGAAAASRALPRNQQEDR